MAIITLITDFGLNSEYVGAMKGVILSINPSARIVDINHQLDPYDTMGAAYQIKAYYSFFPRGTIHVAVVDPGVGGSRHIIAIQLDGYTFLAPDNGILSLVVEEGQMESGLIIENDQYFLKPVSQTFHGRDIFAPVAAHLSLGEDFRNMGKPVESHQLHLLDFQKAYFSDEGQLIGHIVSIDRFGNLITNIESSKIDMLSDEFSRERIEITVNRQRIRGLSSSFDSVAYQTTLGIIGSRGYLEIAVNCGSAQQVIDAARGDKVTVTLLEKGNFHKA